MSSGVASISQKVKALFRGRHDGRGSPARVDPQNRLSENTENTHVPPSQRSSAQESPPRSLAPQIGRDPYPRLIDSGDDIVPHLETPVTEVDRRPGSSGGRAEAQFPEASPPAFTPPWNPCSYNPGYHRAATPSPQPSISPSIGSAPSPAHQAQDLLSPTSTVNVVTGVSYFPGAYGFNIENQQIHNTNITPSKTVFEYLDEHIVHSAAHNSNERCDAPACHEETRVAIRQDIVSWIMHGEGDVEPKRIMWLSGPAGAGKTAIAGSVAEECEKAGLLAGSFMFSSFSGSPGRMSKRGFITTLAYHLSQHKALHLFTAQLLKVLEERRDIYHKQLKEQAECLILAPLRSIEKGGRVGWPSAVIIDGLDEVVAERRGDPAGRQHPRTSEEDQVEILNVLLTLSQSSSFPFRIFISSRPESNITEFFAAGTAQSSTLKLFLDSKYDPDTDIELFLRSKFAEIRRRRGISDTWPGEGVLSRLLDVSSGQFIVPATIFRWIEAGVPQTQLDEVLCLQREIIGFKNPFASLDVLYRHILLRTCNPDDDPRLVVKWILLMNPDLGHQYYISRGSPTIVWSFFLEDWEGEFNYRMEPMSSLVSIPPPHDTNSHIAFYHKSLADFLSTKSRCGDDLYVEDTEMYPFIARRLLQTFKKKQVDVPLPLPDSCFGYLALLVVDSNIVLSANEQQGAMKSFLLYGVPNPDNKVALSACDVAWWLDSIHNTCQWHTGLLEGIITGIYCTIHKAMECNHNIPSSHEHSATKQARNLHCHETCLRWRSNILTQAKELGWCVHRLKEIEVDELENVKWRQVQGLLQNVRTRERPGHSWGCDVCLIPALEDASRHVRRRLSM